MKKNPQIFWTIVLLALVLLVWGFLSFKGGDGNSPINNLLGTESNKTEELPLGEGQTVTNIAGGDKEYKHTVLGFSFNYSKDYSISSFGNFFDSNGETILLQNTGGVQGLQILVTPFDEDISLTAKRIKKDLPSLSVVNEKEIQIGGGDIKVQAVTFESSNNLSTGKSIEGWFVYRKNLYQISSSEISKDLFEKVISTWKLEE